MVCGGLSRIAHVEPLLGQDGSAQRAVAVALRDLVSLRAGNLSSGDGVDRKVETNGTITTVDGTAQHTKSMSTSSMAAREALCQLASQVLDAGVLD